MVFFALKFALSWSSKSDHPFNPQNCSLAQLRLWKASEGTWHEASESSAVQVTKYKTRNGISSRDLLRLAHPKPSDLGKRKREAEADDMQLVLHFAAHMDEEVSLITISMRMQADAVSCD